MKIDPRNLDIGMIIEKDIITKDGKLLIKAGVVLDERKKELLIKRKDDIGVIEIEGEDSTIKVGTINGAKDSLKNFKRNLHDPKAIEDVKDAMKAISDEIDKNEGPFESNALSYMHEIDTYAHPVRVACLSMVIAKIYNSNLKRTNPNIDEKSLINLEEIAMAAVLHNIGEDYKEDDKFNKITKIVNIHIDKLGKTFPGIKDTPLDKYDKKYSSVYSASIISLIKGISGNSRMMVLLSNEPENGKGCLKLSPEFSNKRTANIYGAKIIHFCDVYDTLMKQAIDGEKISLENIISLIEYYSVNGQINREIEQLMINNIKIYPRGMDVMLSTGERAKVRDSFIGRDTYKPIVWTFIPPRRRIDLREVNNITITSIIGKKSRDIMRQQIKSGAISALSEESHPQGEGR